MYKPNQQISLSSDGFNLVALLHMLAVNSYMLIVISLGLKHDENKSKCASIMLASW